MENFLGYNEGMKWITLLTLTLSFLFLSCGQAPVTKSERGPASVQAPQLWGKSVTPESQDFLEDIENAPARKYKSNYKETN